MGIFGNSMFLLQDDIVWFKEEDPVVSTIFLVTLAVIIIAVIVINIVRNGIGAGPKGSGSGGGGKSSGSSTRNFSIFQMRKVASFYGLDKDQTKLLEYVFKNDGVSNPETVMQNVPSLDRHFKRAYKSIEKSGESEQEVQDFLTLLFSIRNTVEAAQPDKSAAAGPARRISENMAAVLSTAKGATYPVRVISSKGNQLLVDCPRNSLGTPVKFARGSKITLSFFTNLSKGFSIESRVQDVLETPQGLALELAHSSKAMALTKRRFKRKEVTISCYFSIVHIEEIKRGRKTERKMSVDPRRSMGTILDISAGGCAVKTTSVVPVGSRIKITFENSEGRSLAALGQVLRTNRSGGLGIIMHIKFIKITRKSLNAVNAMVFGYDQD
ncbi:PilZ domain-containing protein [Breznakiella homolactica]|uniref:PilZ domain-containing protein n=1 Tax=Breznakiella homolactica TaxID=2798577 RepID=A0A7T7XJG5_9SPIR|nr:PilZ domain-containing protein [Breznakiella homolactica]QQO07530.1 PilZ domain-containing protein [Breznakiella homolactica]